MTKALSHSKKAGNYRSTKSGAGMTRKGVKNYRRKHPGSKLKTAVTGKVKPGSKAAKRRKSFWHAAKWNGVRAGRRGVGGNGKAYKFNSYH